MQRYFTNYAQYSYFMSLLQYIKSGARRFCSGLRKAFGLPFSAPSDSGSAPRFPHDNALFCRSLRGRKAEPGAFAPGSERPSAFGIVSC